MPRPLCPICQIRRPVKQVICYECRKSGKQHKVPQEIHSEPTRTFKEGRALDAFLCKPSPVLSNHISGNRKRKSKISTFAKVLAGSLAAIFLLIATADARNSDEKPVSANGQSPKASSSHSAIASPSRVRETSLAASRTSAAQTLASFKPVTESSLNASSRNISRVETSTKKYEQANQAPATVSGSERYYDQTYRPAVGSHYVSGHYRSDGTWVNGHYRTNRDDSFWNNWSSRGNINPHTGRAGYKAPPSYQRSAKGSTYVRSYYRKDGTHVSGHYRRK